MNTVRGNEEYVHLKSLEDEFHYVESNMPPKDGAQGPGGHDKDEQSTAHYETGEGGEEGATGPGRRGREGEEKEGGAGEFVEQREDLYDVNESMQQDGGDLPRKNLFADEPSMDRGYGSPFPFFTGGYGAEGPKIDLDDLVMSGQDMPEREELFDEADNADNGAVGDDMDFLRQTMKNPRDYTSKMDFSTDQVIPPRQSDNAAGPPDHLFAPNTGEEEDVADPSQPIMPEDEEEGQDIRSHLSRGSTYQSLHEID